MNATKAIIVTADQGTIEVAAENIEAAASIRGWNVVGFFKPYRAGNCRPEIDGAPRFDGLVGPMYGGPGVVRYEDSKTNDLLSA